MDTRELAQLVSDMMTTHRTHEWVMLRAGGHREPLRGEVRLVADPSRTATVQVDPGAEVFLVEFEGYSSTEFAYNDDEQVDALRGCIDLAAAATRGPTRVTLDLVGDVVIRSLLVVDPDGPARFEVAGSSYPLRRLSAGLRGRALVHKVIDLPAAED